MRETYSDTPRLFDDAPLPEFVQRLRNAGFIPIGSLLEQLERELPPHNTRQAGQFIGAAVSCSSRAAITACTRVLCNPARTLSTTKRGLPASG